MNRHASLFFALIQNLSLLARSESLVNCNQGYDLIENECVDINECAISTDLCPEDAQCFGWISEQFYFGLKISKDRAF